jgi:amino acid transporter
MIFLILFLVPVAALFWLALVSHSGWPKRIGALAAAMTTTVGALTMPPLIPDELSHYDISNVREGAALFAAATGSIYLLVWTRLHRGRGRNRTLASIAAIVGLVPILAAVAAALYPVE